MVDGGGGGGGGRRGGEDGGLVGVGFGDLAVPPFHELVQHFNRFDKGNLDPLLLPQY